MEVVDEEEEEAKKKDDDEPRTDVFNFRFLAVLTVMAPGHVLYKLPAQKREPVQCFMPIDMEMVRTWSGDVRHLGMC